MPIILSVPPPPHHEITHFLLAYAEPSKAKLVIHVIISTYSTEKSINSTKREFVRRRSLVFRFVHIVVHAPVLRPICGH